MRTAVRSPCIRAVAIAISALAGASPAIAWQPLPLETFNQGPLVQIYGLPSLGSADVLAPGHHRADLRIGIANHNVSTQAGAENLTLDGETHRATFALYRGLRQNWEAGIEIPYVRHGGGFLDSFIEGWHDFFGLPQGGREQTPRDQLLYQYQRNGSTRITLTESGGGLGDIRLAAGRALTSSDSRVARTTLRINMTLPTGDSNRLFGSDAPGAALWLSARCHELSCRDRLAWYGGGGLLWLGRGDVLTGQQRRLVAFGSAGLHWQVGSRVALQLQMDGHTPFYDESELKTLGYSSLQLVLGGRWRLEGRHTLEFGVAEDLVVDTAPDVALHVGLRSWF